MTAIAETARLESIGHITGLFKGSTPLGGCKVETGASGFQHIIADFFNSVLAPKETHSSHPLLPIPNDIRQVGSC